MTTAAIVTTAITASPTAATTNSPMLPSSAFCLTGIATELYVVLISASVVLFAYHLLLVLFWPKLFRKWKKERRRRLLDSRADGPSEDAPPVNGGTDNLGLIVIDECDSPL